MTHNTTCTQLLWEKKTVSYLVIEIHIYDELWPYVWRPYNTKILRQLCLFQHCKTWTDDSIVCLFVRDRLKHVVFNLQTGNREEFSTNNLVVTCSCRSILNRCTWERRDGHIGEVGGRPAEVLRVRRREHVEERARRDGGEGVDVAAAPGEQHRRPARRLPQLVDGHHLG